MFFFFFFKFVRNFLKFLSRDRECISKPMRILTNGYETLSAVEDFNVVTSKEASF